MHLQAETASRRLHVSRLWFRIGIDRVAEQGHDAHPGDQLVQQVQTLRSDLDVQHNHAGEISSWSVQAGEEAGCDRVAGGKKDDRYGRRRRLGHGRGRGVRGDHAHLSAKEIGGQRRQTLVATLGPAVFDPYITALYIAGFAEALAEGVCELRIFPGRSAVEEPDYGHRRLLRAHRERPCCRAAEQRDEVATFHLRDHSITSSARASTVGGTSRPSALAVVRLMTSSSLVGCKTGKSAGFSPLRMRLT